MLTGTKKPEGTLIFRVPLFTGELNEEELCSARPAGTVHVCKRWLR
jgi:hypothetical protein